MLDVKTVVNFEFSSVLTYCLFKIQPSKACEAVNGKHSISVAIVTDHKPYECLTYGWDLCIPSRFLFNDKVEAKVGQ